MNKQWKEIDEIKLRDGSSCWASGWHILRLYYLKYSGGSVEMKMGFQLTITPLSPMTQEMEDIKITITI